jgi:hypothetical protein
LFRSCKGGKKTEYSMPKVERSKFTIIMHLHEISDCGLLCEISGSHGDEYAV